MAELCAFSFVVPIPNSCGLFQSLDELASCEGILCVAVVLWHIRESFCVVVRGDGVLYILCVGHCLLLLQYFSIPLEAVARTVQAKSGVLQTIPLQTPIIRFVLILERRPFVSKVIY